MSANTTKKVSIAEASRVVEEGLQLSDRQRFDGLQGLSKFRISKAKMQTRESERLKDKYGAKNERTVESNSKLQANEEYIGGLRMEANRANLEQEQVDERTWVAKGRVYDRRGSPIAGAKVAVIHADGKPVGQIEPVTTDAKGRYRFVYRSDEKQRVRVESGGEQQETTGTRINTNVEKAQGTEKLSSGLRINKNRYNEAVFIRAVDARDETLCAESTLMVPKIGKCNYRDLIFDTDQSFGLISDLDKDRRSSRYLGNASTLELHDLSNEKAACKIDQIRADRLVRFKSVEEAQALGYDFCAYCFPRGKSKR